MSNSLITISVAVYNVEQYLPRCIESIINQTYKNIEILLVDDGSLDGSAKICDEYATKDSRIKVIHKKNGGVADVRNMSIAEAKGEYIALIDGDDWLDPMFIELLYQGVQTGVDIAECATALVDNDENVLSTRGIDECTLSRDEALEKLISEQGIYSTVCNKLYKRSIIENVPFPVGKYHEDDYWVWQAFKASNGLYYCKKPMYNYLQRDNGFTGCAYSVRRLYGLRARYERMLGVSDIPRVKEVARIAFINTVLYNFQATSKYLKGDEKKKALKEIMDYKKGFKITKDDYKYATGKPGMWLRLFMAMPRTTVAVRNIFGIGY
ncbi:MAG: glycosyltransferase family 2 protein [Acutalibacteraceae bacterium]|nr:glycosyltransferase family 2 protein [Acutalibacteraceae bacterium]